LNREEVCEESFEENQSETIVKTEAAKADEEEEQAEVIIIDGQEVKIDEEVIEEEGLTG
jgi:tyrosine-protein phosphatase YwqE